MRLPGFRRPPTTDEVMEAAATLRQTAGYASVNERLDDVFRCAQGFHDFETMTTARQGYVRWERCKRGCGAQRIVKGK